MGRASARGGFVLLSLLVLALPERGRAEPAPVTASAAVVARPARAADAIEERLFPTDGLDRVFLDDGRVLRCRVLEDVKDSWTLEFPTTKFTLPRKGIEVRFWRDYDPAPRTPGEKTLADKGLVRFAGQWVSAEHAAERRGKEIETVRKERDEDEAHATWAKRWRVPSEHFRFESNLPRRRIDEYASLLEEFCKTVKEGLALTIPSQPLRVLLFRNREEFVSVSRTEGIGVPPGVAGYYVRPQKGAVEFLALYDRPGDAEKTLDVLLHEATHWIVIHGGGDKVKHWLNEGLAEYYGGSTWRWKKFHAGGIQGERLLWFLDMVEQKKVIPLDTLLEFDRGPDGEFGLDHYAESWLFIHFLMHGRQGAYRGAFRDAVRGNVKECRAQLLQRMQRKDFTKITEEMTAYAKGLGEKLPLGTAYALRGQRRQMEGNEAGAAADLQRALDAKEKDPETWRLVAAAYSRTRAKRGEVAALLRKVVEVEPLDARSRALLANALPPGEGVADARLAAALASDDAETLGIAARAIAADALGVHLRLKEKDAEKHTERKGRAEEAYALAAKAAAAGGGWENALTAAHIAFVLGRFADAARHGEAGARADPNEALLVALTAAARGLDGKPEGFAETLGGARVRWLAAEKSAKGAAARGEKPAAEAPGDGDPRKAAAAGGERWMYAMMVATNACLEWGAPKVLADGLERIYQNREPTSSKEWIHFAAALATAGRRDEAARALARARELHPEDPIPKVSGMFVVGDPVAPEAPAEPKPEEK